MLYRFFVSFVFVSVFVSQVLAAPKQLPQTEFAAMATAEGLNSFKSIDDYLTWLAFVGEKADLDKVRAELVKLGVNLKAKFPKAMYKGDKVYFDNDNYIIYGKNTLTVNGKKVALNRQSAHQIFLGICAQIGCTKPTAGFSIFEKAHAGFDFRSGLAGAAALGGLAYLFGPAGAAGKGALAGLLIGGLFMNRKHHNNCNNSGWFGSGNCSVDYGGGNCGYSGGNSGSGRVRIYGDYNQGSCDQLALDVQNPSSPLGYGYDSGNPGTQDDLYNDLGGARATATSKDGKAKRGTTSVPKK